ncbi:hypothetical protein HDU79_000655 [Rhizoclosmatium sp. JEL0117]|nr:hypothetical protein HDU79_000655 [Rhizoclosmatium sp. JEL0117]
MQDYQPHGNSSDHLFSDSESEDDFSGSRRSPKQRKSPGERKKPGRKAIQSDSGSKRIDQNRKAQRAFRERKEAYLHGLETQVKEQAARIEELTAMNLKLQQENALLKLNSSDPLASSTSPVIAPISDLNLFSGPQNPDYTHTPSTTSSDQSPVNKFFLPNQSTIFGSPEAYTQQPIQAQSPPQNDIFAFLSMPATQQSPQPPQPQQYLDQNPLYALYNSTLKQESSVPEFKATMDILDSQPSSALDPSPIRIPQLAAFQSALKQLPSLQTKSDLIDELCTRFVSFTTKSSSQGLPHIDQLPIVTDEQKRLLQLHDAVLEACDAQDNRKALEIMSIARIKHRVHYERLRRYWSSFFTFQAAGGASVGQI